MPRNFNLPQLQCLQPTHHTRFPSPETECVMETIDWWDRFSHPPPPGRPLSTSEPVSTGLLCWRGVSMPRNFNLPQLQCLQPTHHTRFPSPETKCVLETIDWWDRDPGDWRGRDPGDWWGRDRGDWRDRDPGDWWDRDPGDWRGQNPCQLVSHPPPPGRRLSTSEPVSTGLLCWRGISMPRFNAPNHR
jgi:hypothetical protein